MTTGGMPGMTTEGMSGMTIGDMPGMTTEGMSGMTMGAWLDKYPEYVLDYYRVVIRLAVSIYAGLNECYDKWAGSFGQAVQRCGQNWFGESRWGCACCRPIYDEY